VKPIELIATESYSPVRDEYDVFTSYRLLFLGRYNVLSPFMAFEKEK